MTLLPHRARDVLHGGTVDREQVVARDEAAKVRRAGRVDAPDDDLCRASHAAGTRTRAHLQAWGWLCKSSRVGYKLWAGGDRPKPS